MLRKVRERLRNLRTRGGGEARGGGSSGGGVGGTARTASSSPRAPQRMWTFGSLGRRRDQRDTEAALELALGIGEEDHAAVGRSVYASGSISPDARTRKRARRFRPLSPAPLAHRAMSAHARTNAAGGMRGKATETRSADDAHIDEEAVSSVPSTHISNDDFLNDAVPVEITRRPAADRRVGMREADVADPPAIVDVDTASVEPVPAASPRIAQDRAQSPIAHSVASAPPSFGTVSASSRRRSALWKPMPGGALAFVREVCHGNTGPSRVAAAHALAITARAHVSNAAHAVTSVERALEAVREAATQLPSARMARFEALLFASDPQFDAPQVDRSFRDLHWKERVCDIEALLAEQRVDAAVSGVEALLADDDYATCESHVSQSVARLSDAIATRLVDACPYETPAAAASCATLLSRLERPDAACAVVLRTAAHILALRLARLPSAVDTRACDIARRVQLALQVGRTQVIDALRAVEAVPLSSARRAALFAAWAAAQTDIIYRSHVRAVIRSPDRAALLQVAAAARMRIDAKKDESAAEATAVFSARVLTNARTHIRQLSRDATLQLLRAATRATRDATHVRSRAASPPRELLALSREVRATLDSLAPIMKELPSLDVHALDIGVARALVAYADRLITAVEADGEAEKREGALRTALQCLGANASEALRASRARAPNAQDVVAALSTAHFVQLRHLAVSLRDNLDDDDAIVEEDVHVRASDAASVSFSFDDALPYVADADIRENARQLLAQHRRVAPAAA